MRDFKTEADLCRVFIEDAEAAGWTAYPETSAWDIILERRGFLVGVQAKLRLDLHAIRQAIDASGVHLKLVLYDVVARSTIEDFGVIGQRCRVLLTSKQYRHGAEVWDIDLRIRRVIFGRPLRWDPDPRWLLHYLYQPRTPAWLPPAPSAAVAGAPSPQTVSPWQFAAIALERRCEARGYVSIHDAREVTAEFKGSWQPRTLLARHFRTTTGSLPGGKRGSRWVVWFRPTEQYAHAVACLEAADA